MFGERVALLEQAGVLLGMRPHDLEHELHRPALPKRDGVHRCTKDAHTHFSSNKETLSVFIDLQGLEGIKDLIN